MPTAMNDGSRSTLASNPQASRALRGLRVWARNSPWLMIALLLHVLLVTILSVVFLQAQRDEVQGSATAVVLGPTTPELPLANEEPPVFVRQDIVPPLASDESRGLEPVEHELFEVADHGPPGDELDAALDPGLFNPDPDALWELPSGSPGSTPIGVGAIGHRGTGVSAFEGRTPGGGGPGGGGPGGPGGGGTGSGREAIAAVHAALDWLKRHQAPDGSWDCDGFALQCVGETCGGSGSGAHDVGVTGLAVLAFLGAGETHVEGSYRNTVKKALEWLRDAQDADGCFGERRSQGFLYDHACATLALAEAYGMTQARPLRGPAQRGVDFALRAQNPYAGWRYAAPPDGDNDTSVTGWMVMALKSAKLAGLTIDDLALENAVAWIEEMTDPATGRTGYTERGGRPSRLSALAGAFPPEHSESMTAAALLVRIFAGRTPASDPRLEAGAELLAARLPRWSPESGEIDFYYWYYGTLAMFQLGGAHWERWNEAIRSAILEHQRGEVEACARGSWDPLDPWSGIGGRIYATALNCLSLEVYYRYPRVFGAAHGGSRR